MKPDVVLASDFGNSTGFPGTMTGVIRKVDQSLGVFDLNHEIRPFDMKQASGLLADNIPFWKDGTVFVCVVDPGVGTARRSCVALLKNGSYVVTPDNGTLTCIFDDIAAIREIDESVNRLPGEGRAETFHGRDVYSYTAARLASGIIDYEGVGPEYPVSEIVRYEIPKAVSEKGRVRGVFRECLAWYGEPSTNITVEDFDNAGFKLGDMVNVVITHKGKTLFNERILYHQSFGFVGKGEPIIYYGGTSPYMELSLNMVKFADKIMPEIYVEEPESFEIEVTK